MRPFAVEFQTNKDNKRGRAVQISYTEILYPSVKCPANEWSPDSGGRQFIRQVDSEDRVAEQYADLKGDARATVQRQVEADHVHQHEEDAGDEEAHHIQQGAPADQHLNGRQGQGFGR